MHVDTDLSAYLDGELGSADRGRVEAHLDTCDRCRGRLNELRATASLISALPSTRPARSLVPHGDRLGTNYGVDAARRGGWNWLRPVRSFSAVASGAFLFVFLVTAVARSGSGLGGGSPTGAFAPPAAAPAAAPQAATAATPAATAAPAGRAPVPAAVPAPGSSATTDTERSGAAASPAAEFARQQTAPQKAAQASTPTAQPLAGTQSSPDAATRILYGHPPPDPLADPLVWLGLAVIAAVVAIATHRRLRTI